MDIRRSDLPLLISLDALLDELNVTRAARRLNITQPSLSGHLAKLRALFDDPLLVPAENGRGMVPTPRALELKPRLSDALNLLRIAVDRNDSFDPATARRTFVIAVNDNFFSIVVLPALARIAAIGNAALRVSFVSSLEAGLVERMERGEIDLYLGDARSVPEPLKSRWLLSDHFEMAQRIGHPRGNSPATLDEYCTLSHVMVSALGHARSQIDEILAAQGRDRNVTVTVPSYNQVALVLAHTDVVATLPSLLLGRYPSVLEVLPVPIDIPTFNVAMAWHARSQEDAGHRWLRQLFIQTAEEARAEHLQVLS